jgi:hypothetical protein
VIGLLVTAVRQVRDGRGAAVGRCGWLVGPGGVGGHGDEGVEGVGLDGFVSAVSAGGGEDLVGDGVEHGGERGAVLGGAAGGQVPAALGVGVLPAAALGVDAPVGGIRVRVGGGPDPGAFLPQLDQRSPRRQLEQSPLRRRVGLGRAGDGCRLRRGQLTTAQRTGHTR